MSSLADILPKNASQVPVGICTYFMQVRPYFFDFKASVKARWRGKSVIDVFLSV